MVTLKPRGRPPADGNCIVWTEPLVENLLRLRFETYSDPSARGSKLTRHSWPKVAAQLTEQNNGDEVSVQQCRNKLKVLKKKWLAYHAGLASEPMCVALMDTYWSGESHEAMANESPRQSRPSPEHQTPIKKPRLTLTSPSSTSLTPIAPAPAPVSVAIAPSVFPSSTVAPTQTMEAASPTSSTDSTADAGTRSSTATSAQLLNVGTSQGFTDIASTADEAVGPEEIHSGGTADLSKLEKLVDDRFAQVLGRQDRQLKLAEEQNQLLARILAALQRNIDLLIRVDIFQDAKTLSKRSRLAMLRHTLRPWSLQFIVTWWLLSCSTVVSTSSSTVYFRQQSGGSIFSIDGRDGTQTELEGSSGYARFVGLSLHRRNERLYWSDGRAINSAKAADGSDTKVVVGALARVVWVGSNFGQMQEDLQELTVKSTPCVSILSWSPERVECLVGLPLRFQPDLVSGDDCSIRTNHGFMTGIALNYNEMLASGTSSPIVERIDTDTSFVLPHALTVDDRQGGEWLYWSNSADGTIYRSSLQSSAIEVLQRHCWSVRGLVLNKFVDSGEERVSLLYSLEAKGSISSILLPPSSTSITSPLPSKVVLSGLRSPRGLAMDCTAQILFFTEKTGRIFEARLGKPMAVNQQANRHPDDASIVGPGVEIRRIVTRTSMTRLDGIAVDSKYLYWCESNTNTVARALRRDFQRQVMVGGTANSMLSWPRGIVLESDDGDTNELQQSFYYSEYTGRISRGASQTIVINSFSAPAMQYLDSVVQQSAIEGGGEHVYFYALE